MYRYSIDNAITYTQDDLSLFRESPFAVWMERLTLENPDHGIPPDRVRAEPGDNCARRDDIVATLRAEGRNVAVIDPQADEPSRRASTLGAMRDGADFIVNAQLALGNLSGSSNLLMRTSGYSDLGDFLYIPCETQPSDTLQTAFRLCFAADLLLGLQGQLPPQMLIIRDGAEVVPLQTEDYIYYYHAVQQRFVRAMSTFRKHRMPDPAESSHFGRWSECACEVLKQRAHSEQQRAAEHQVEEQQVEAVEMPQLRVAAGSGAVASANSSATSSATPSATAPHYEAQVREQSGSSAATPGDAAVSNNSSATMRGDAGPTLAEQASLLTPGSFRADAAPGHTPNLARFGRARTVAAVPDHADSPNKSSSSIHPDNADKQNTQHNRRSTDAALQNLEFIGSTPAGTAGDVAAFVRLSDNSQPIEDLQSCEGIRSTEDIRPSEKMPPDEYVRPSENVRQNEDVRSTDTLRPAPEPNLREIAKKERPAAVPAMAPVGSRLPDLEPRAPMFLPPDKPAAAEVAPERPKLQPQPAAAAYQRSVVDLDSAPPPTLAPIVQRAEEEFERVEHHPAFRSSDLVRPKAHVEDANPAASPFSSSLITSSDFNDR